MTAPDPSLVRALFDEATDRPPAERAAFVASRCAGDEALRREVMELLDAEAARHGPNLSASPFAGALEALESELVPGARTGAFRLLRRIGSGGFGEVWLAEREEPFRQTVAVKFIRPGMGSQDVVKRFERERQALAVMEHPGIAKVLDAGTTASGRPYFVMEWVSGQPVDAFCDGRSMPLDDRLRLFAAVCDAVQHAHSKGIVHRDLKPANVLAAVPEGEPDAAAAPKVIDFGIAKALEPEPAEALAATRGGEPMGTPAYMSPEQASGGAIDVDTRTDVYALGAILHELCTGLQPLDLSPTPTHTSSDVVRRIREEEPPRSSVRLRRLEASDPARLAGIATLRRLDPRGLIRRLDGDLDWIVARCLEKDRTRRYPTPQALAADLRRHLAHEPVEAGPPSRAYRLRKFVRRHRIGVAAGTAIALLVAAGLVVALLLRAEAVAAASIATDEGVRANLAADRARQEREAADRAIDMLVRTFDAASPLDAHSSMPSALDLLNAGRTALENLPAGEGPLIRARLLEAFARSYFHLGRYDDALESQRAAAAAAEAAYGPTSEPACLARARIGYLLGHRGDLEAAERMIRAALAGLEQVESERPAERVEARLHLCEVVHDRRRAHEAHELYSTLLDEATALLGPTHRNTLLVQSGLAKATRVIEGDEAALPLYRAQLEDCLAAHGARHPDTLTARNNLGSLLTGLGELDEAEALLLETWNTRAEVLGPAHPDTLISLGNLAFIRSERGQLTEAKRDFEAVYEGFAGGPGLAHPEAMTHLRNLSHVCLALGELDRAAEIATALLETQETVLGESDPETLGTMGTLGILRYHQGDLPAARALFERQCTIVREHQAPGSASRTYALKTFASFLLMTSVDEGGVLVDPERAAQSREKYRALQDELLATLGAADFETMLAAAGAAKAELTLGPSDSALAELERFAGATRDSRMRSDPQRLNAIDALVSGLVRAGRAADALALAEEALACTPETSPARPLRIAKLQELAAAEE